MRRLFWSIFLSFWAALIVFSAATMLAVSFMLEQARERGALKIHDQPVGRSVGQAHFDKPVHTPALHIPLQTLGELLTHRTAEQIVALGIEQ